MDPRKLFDNGWAFATIFLIAGGGLLWWQHQRGPWLEASAVVPGQAELLRYRSRPSMLPIVKAQRQLMAVKAGSPARLLARGDMQLPLAVLTADGITLVKDSNGKFWSADWPGKNNEKLVGIFVQEAGRPRFIPRGDDLSVMQLHFRRAGMDLPDWLAEAWKRAEPKKKKTVRKKPKKTSVDPEVKEKEKEAKAARRKKARTSYRMWKSERAFLEELLRQHAPGLFTEHRVPEKEDRRGGWRDNPREDGSPRFLARGDFNGDRLKDFAFILPRHGSGGFGVFALLSTSRGEYSIRRLSQGEGRPQRFSIDRARPGIYKASGASESRLENPVRQGEIAIDTDSLRFSQLGRWSSLLVWDANSGSFEDVAVSE